METEKKYKDLLVGIIKKHIPVGTILLFGSRARKTHGTGSDFDIAIDTGQSIDRRIIGNISEEIENSNIPLSMSSIYTQFLQIAESAYDYYQLLSTLLENTRPLT